MKKTATQSRKQTFDDPAEPNAATTLDNSGAEGAEHGYDLAGLVWKYFADEISETLQEVHEALTAEEERLKS